MPFIIAAAVALLGCLLTLRAFARSTRRDREWFAGKVIVSGTVTKCKETEDFDYWSTVEYRARDGRPYQLTGDFKRFRPSDIGTAVEIAYDRNLPSEARLVEKPEERSIAGDLFLLLAIFAGLFLVTVPVVMVVMRVME
ncbi:MAG TPA: DUF3592 domain-containing protein [Thermoanaerobaculia bacterium]|nr:DUF3592 domain-containing protein [Thermoanaerobaculia bacterium]